MKFLSLNCQRSYRQNDLHQFLHVKLASNYYTGLILQEVTMDIKDLITTHDYQVISLDEIDGKKSSVVVAIPSHSKILQVVREVDYIQKTSLHDYTFGFISVLLEINNRQLFLGSIHQAAYLQFRRRKKFLSNLMNKLNTNQTTLIGGDFNTALPFEVRDLIKSVEPFKVATTDGPTHDLKLLERGLFMNNTAAIFGHIVPTKLKLDHVVHSPDLSPQVKILDITISDHKPLEIFL